MRIEPSPFDEGKCAFWEVEASDETLARLKAYDTLYVEAQEAFATEREDAHRLLAEFQLANPKLDAACEA